MGFNVLAVVVTVLRVENDTLILKLLIFVSTAAMYPVPGQQYVRIARKGNVVST